MTEEKKQQQDFLRGHEALLNSINKKRAENQTAATQTPPAQEKPETVPPRKAVAEELPAEEPVMEAQAESFEDAEIEAELAEEEQGEEVLAEAEPIAAHPAPTKAPAKAAHQGGGKKKKKHAPSPEAARTDADKQRHEVMLKQQALKQQEVEEVLGFLQKYSKPATIAIVAVCALFLADRLLKNSRANKERKADAALLDARTAADYQAILDDFGSTPSAPLALMGLALERFNAGQVQDAVGLYGDFSKKYPQHELAEQAEFNQITCKEALGQTGDAHLLYGEFAKKHADSHLAPVALIAQARCLESLSLPAEAKQVYEDVITYHPGTGWSRMAEASLKVVEAKLK